MGNEAENLEGGNNSNVGATLDSQGQNQNPGELETQNPGDPGVLDEEVEIVLEGDSPSPNGERKQGSGVRRLIKRIDRAKSENEALRAENELLRRNASGQGNAEDRPLKRPTMESCGHDEDEFNRQLDAYEEQRDKRFLSQVQSSVTQHVQPANNGPSPIDKHYERAEKLNVSDFNEAQDAAIEVMGQAVVSQIAENFSKSEYLIYYLGKNPVKAQEIQRLAASNPIAAAAELGVLQNKLSLKPKTRQSIDPEAKLEPGGSAPTTADAWGKKIDAMRDKVSQGKASMKDLLALKQQAREAGA